MNNRDWTGNSKCAYSTIGASNHSEGDRAGNDFYATDPKAVELLLEQEKFCPNIWEPACGQGHISKVLEKHGYAVKSTDLVDRGYGTGGVDFLQRDYLFSPIGEDKVPLGGGNFDIVTNPPYKYALEFVENSMQVIASGQKVAMLLRLLFLESKARRKLFEKYPPKVIYVPSGRLKCAKNGDFKDSTGSAICYSWFVWQKDYKGPTVIRWIN